ncbi:MAG: hypothetical protein RIB03_15775 [Henriciella sp.]|uniref:hypothetical protein n=1 Tax=Henriciella sp. TaxID=1968823 RepID=UPI0032F078C1
MAGFGQSKGKPEDKAQSLKQAGTLKAILVLTLMVLTAALGLMIWNSYQARNAEDLKLLQRDALLLGERFNRKADRATDRLESELRSGSRLSSISTDFIGVSVTE